MYTHNKIVSDIAENERDRVVNISSLKMLITSVVYFMILRKLSTMPIVPKNTLDGEKLAYRAFVKAGTMLLLAVVTTLLDMVTLNKYQVLNIVLLFVLKLMDVNMLVGIKKTSSVI